MNLKLYWTFVRPFTLLVPAFGMLCAALMALGADPRWTSDWSQDAAGVLLRVLAGALLAASLNAYSNSINQIYDVELDRVNKPERLLPSGRITFGQAWLVTTGSLLFSLALAYGISRQTFAIVAAAAFLTYAYSAPPLRTKRLGILANFTIAIPRGTLLVVCGWSTVKTVAVQEPWVIGGIFGIYFLGAVTTKDFSDIEGDRKGGCNTLPVKYGIARAAWMISPFLVFPFMAIVPATLRHWLQGNPFILLPIGILLPAWGVYIAFLLVRDPEGLSRAVVPGSGLENHPSWKHMYLLTLAAQVGFALAYLLR